MQGVLTTAHLRSMVARAHRRGLGQSAAVGGGAILVLKLTKSAELKPLQNIGCFNRSGSPLVLFVGGRLRRALLFRVSGP